MHTATTTPFLRALASVSVLLCLACELPGDRSAPKEAADAEARAAHGEPAPRGAPPADPGGDDSCSFATLQRVDECTFDADAGALTLPCAAYDALVGDMDRCDRRVLRSKLVERLAGGRNSDAQRWVIADRLYLGRYSPAELEVIVGAVAKEPLPAIAAKLASAFRNGLPREGFPEAVAPAFATAMSSVTNRDVLDELVPAESDCSRPCREALLSGLRSNPNLANRVRLAKPPWRPNETIPGHCEATGTLVVELLRAKPQEDLKPRDAAGRLVRFLASTDGPCVELPMMVLDEVVARAEAGELTTDVFASVLEYGKTPLDDIRRKRLDDVVRIVAEKAPPGSMLAMLAAAALGPEPE